MRWRALVVTVPHQLRHGRLAEPITLDPSQWDCHTSLCLDATDCSDIGVDELETELEESQVFSSEADAPIHRVQALWGDRLRSRVSEL